jgi:hypothetical protein
MTSLEAGDGGVREASVLMVCPADEGWKVGLKDDDAGGWLWRVGDTVGKALDAIETALEAGTAKFGGRKVKPPTKRP